jgi:hypothetical protein
MKWGGDRRSNQGANLHLENISKSTAAELLNVSPRLVAAVKAVEREAPELVEKIERGEMTAHEAENQTEKQLQICSCLKTAKWKSPPPPNC